jgi:hypothetical protein
MAKFEPGKSGNTAGRPKNTPDRRSELRELIKPHAAKLVYKAVSLALAGDVTAIRMLLDKVIPPLKSASEPAPFALDETDVTTQAAEIFRAAANGELALDEATSVIRMLLDRARISEIDELNRNAVATTRKVEALRHDSEELSREYIDQEIQMRCKLCKNHKRR